MSIHRMRCATAMHSLVTLAGATVFALSATARGQGSTIILRETRIYYEAAGRGPAVVFIHGFAVNLREWDDQMKALSPYYRVVAYDRRGFGKSTGDPDPSAEPADLKELLDSLGVRSAVLVGHSGGAGVALRFAIAFGGRVDGLVLYPGPMLPGFPIAPSEPFPMAPMQAIARQYGMDSVYKFLGSLPMFWNPPNRPDIEERIKAMTATYSGRDLIEGRTLSGRYPQPTFQQVKQLPMPTLYIVGEREWPHFHLVSDSMARWMPNARKVVIAGGAHGVHFAEPERFNAALLAFLGSLASGTGR